MENKLIINASPVYNLHHEFKLIRDTFSDDARARKIDLFYSAEDDIPVAFWDINSLRIHVFNNILSSIECCNNVDGTISIDIKKSNAYTISIKISCSGAVLQGVDSDRLNSALECIQAHKGTLNIINESESSSTIFMIEIPLFALCIQ